MFLDLQPAPPVGFNLTFMCPEGQVWLLLLNCKLTKIQVFDHDWFATAFVMLTCQVCPDCCAKITSLIPHRILASLMILHGTTTVVFGVRPMFMAH